MVTHAEAPRFYARHGLAQVDTWRRARVSTRLGNTIYTAEKMVPGDYAMLRGWAMPVGRYQSARQEWERVRPGAEPDFEAWRDLRQGCWRLEVRHEPAVLRLEEAPRERGVADVHLWTPASGELTPASDGVTPAAAGRTAALSRQVVAAIRDLGAKAGFHELMFFVPESALPQLGAGWRDDGYKQRVWMKSLAPARDEPGPIGA